MEKAENWKRARRPDQIEARRSAILSATRNLLEQEGVAGAGLTAIARESGLSKANLYRYFESREAILLELFEMEVSAWSQHFVRLLESLPKHSSVYEVAQALADSLRDRRVYGILFSELAPVIEPRLSETLVIRSRRSLREAFVGLIESLRCVLPGFSKSQLNEFLTMHAMFMAGLWPHASPNETLSLVMKREEFAGMEVDFLDRIRWHALVLLLGLESVSQPRIRPFKD